MPNWDSVLREIQKTTPTDALTSSFDVVRRKYLFELHKHTGRNAIFYYSGFLTKPNVEGVAISDEDKNGFMLCVHELDRHSGVDLFLHTPGGDIGATESLVHYLREMFPDIRAVVPQIAMSAGTMIACACREILLGKHSNLGPVDPQVNGLPAIGVIREVERAFDDIRNDQRAALLWNPILSRLTPSFVQLCHWAIGRSKEFVAEVLRSGMFAGLDEPTKTERVEAAVNRLTDLSVNKAHDRHLHHQDCVDIGLNIELLEKNGNEQLQELVLTIHHCFMHTLANTGAIKIIENHLGRAYVKMLPQPPQFLMQMPASVIPRAVKE